MTETDKVEKVKALLEEARELSAELSEDELKQVAGGAGGVWWSGAWFPRPDGDLACAGSSGNFEWVDITCTPNGFTGWKPSKNYSDFLTWCGGQGVE
jgi:hypothetical protein